VIVDEVMMTADEWRDWGEALEGIDVRWVAVRCDLDTVAARERERGDRLPGLARGTGLAVHDHATYDAEIDTSELSTSEAAERLDSLLQRC
jgi:chloramphenicol 3-O phosphotransferase